MFKPKYVKEILFDNKQIVHEISVAGKWLSNRFKNIKEPIIAICILKGAVQFYSHLTEKIEHDLIYDFTTLKSYRGTKQAVSKPKIIKNLSISVKDKHVLVIEDVADTANTLTLLLKNLKLQKPKSITTIVLADKKDCRVKKFKPDYACFTIKGNPFIIGYGLDYNEIGRNLPYIGVFDKNIVNLK